MKKAKDKPVVWYKQAELDALNNCGKQKEPRKGEVVEVLLPVKVLFKWSDKIVDHIDEEGNVTSWRSG